MLYICISYLDNNTKSTVGLPNNSYKHITNTACDRARLCKLQKRCTLHAAASDKVYQLLAHDRWFSPSTPTSSTTKTGRHDIVEILLKMALNTINHKIKSTQSTYILWIMFTVRSHQFFGYQSIRSISKISFMSYFI